METLTSSKWVNSSSFRCPIRGSSASTMSYAAALPPELVDEILDFLKHDRPALLRCSMVSHRWCYSSSRHLFHTLQLRETPVGFPDDPVEALFTFVTGNERIRPFVQELQLINVDTFMEVSISIDCICALMCILPFIHTIYLGSVHLRTPRYAKQGSNNCYASSVAHFNLRHLSLSTSVCSSVHLSHFLALFSRVDHIQFYSGISPRRFFHGDRQHPHFSSHSSQFLGDATLPPPPSVRSVTFSRSDSAEKILPLLPIFTNMESLEGIHLSHFLGHIVPMIDAAVRRATNLREITLFFNRFASPNLAYAMGKSFPADFSPPTH